MRNALRFVRYSVSVSCEHFPRGRHARHTFPGTLASALGGAAILTLPVWMILLGVI